ncbi:DUF6628 family protein [Sphingosinithalassobacter sp. CS137]|uniref:DUF6628 family protein n=1 Tax=Sphingosinithalassobacter sp. CS137 TaxID=2762748 RepID=UPI00165E73BC|nr:DUF6628 family protein [Sphingosinithalassobacter sp. CS137]
MTSTTSLAAALPALQPDDPGARLLLFGVRQMGAHGLYDACAAQAFLMAFGREFRRPLMLLRALMSDMSSAAEGPIQIAPWCCPRMTGAEATLLAVLGRAAGHPETAHMLLADLLGKRDAGGVLATAHALAGAFADLGLPLGGD